jgi:hypothetical protein
MTAFNAQPMRDLEQGSLVGEDRQLAPGASAAFKVGANAIASCAAQTHKAELLPLPSKRNETPGTGDLEGGFRHPDAHRLLLVLSHERRTDTPV